MTTKSKSKVVVTEKQIEQVAKREMKFLDRWSQVQVIRNIVTALPKARRIDLCATLFAVGGFNPYTVRTQIQVVRKMQQQRHA